MKNRLSLMHRLIRRLYSQEELRTLCVDLGVDPDDLGSGGKQAMARELVLWMNRRGRFNELLDKLPQDRPGIFDQQSSTTDEFILEMRRYWHPLETTIEMENADSMVRVLDLETATCLVETSLREVTDCHNASISLIDILSKHIEQSKQEKIFTGKRVIEEEMPDFSDIGTKLKLSVSQIDRMSAQHWLMFARGIDDIAPKYREAWGNYEKGARALLQSLKGQPLIRVRDSMESYLDTIDVLWAKTLKLQAMIAEFTTDSKELARALQRSAQAFNEHLKIMENGIAFILEAIQRPPDTPMH
jgi:hypothetical protein